MKIRYSILIITALACNNSRPPEKKTEPSAAKVPVDTIPVTDNACVFDTSTYKFTTDALKKFNPHLGFAWRNEDETAVVPLSDRDTLFLHIGGCDHFLFQAVYRTDSSRFNDSVYFFKKTKWLAENFFSQGFDTKYAECISGELYKKEESEQPDLKFYSIRDPDTTMTDHVYEGFSIRRLSARAEITIDGYVD
jgi:hypothetical protein